MRKAKFVVPGPPVGYVATTHKAKISEQYLKFADYARKVRLYARAAGIRVPLVATKDRPLVIRTIAYFTNGVHCDPGNVQKGIVDALFYDEDKAALAKLQRRMGRRKRTTGKGDDKHTGGSFPPPLYDKKNPRVVVIIKDYAPKKRKKTDGEKEQGSRKERPKRAPKKARAKATETTARQDSKSSKGSKKNVRTRRTRR